MLAGSYFTDSNSNYLEVNPLRIYWSEPLILDAARLPAAASITKGHMDLYMSATETSLGTIPLM